MHVATPTDLDPDEPSNSLWSGDVETDHRTVIESARLVVASERLAAPSARATLVHLAAEWGLAGCVGVLAHLVDDPVVWVISWLVIAWVFAGNAAIMHEAVHGHLFRSKGANRVLGTAAIAMLFGSFASYRAYHWEHHARTAQKGDPEGTPLSMNSRPLYLGLLLVGGLAVLVENHTYTLLTVVGRPPTWASKSRHRRAMKLNALLLVGVVGVAVGAIFVSPRVTLEAWLIPAAIAAFVLLPLLLLPEHYGATGVGDILSNTRSVKS
ncbi:MAG TPA: fatty acid desaturase, partial [Acidimicrobiales bacterium]|nr:fatty acid desaturase [Acidimicrobiales bacterium]